MSSAYNKFNSLVEAMSEKVHNFGSDTLKLALTNVAPTGGNTQLSNLTEIAYTFCSSRVLTVLSSSQTGGTYTLVLQDLILTATGGAVGPFRYVAVYNDTATNDELVAWFDYGSAVTLADGETLTVDFGANLFSLA
jgi:hypothetical protein